MPTLLRMPDEIYQRELPYICAPHGAYYMLRDALYGRPAPQPHFYSHLLEFLARNYNAPAHLLEDAFTVLQQDLEQGRVLITDPWALWPAFFWIPAKEDKEGYWHLGNHVFAEHRAILQLTLDNAKSDVPGASVDGAMEAPSALSRTFDKAKGAAKQFANDIARRTAAQHAEWQAANGIATFTDTTTGQVLSADEVKDRWEIAGNDMVPIAGGDEAQGAQMVKESPALGAAVSVAQTAASRGRNIIQHPGDIGKDIAKAVQGLRGPKDKQLPEALGKIGGEQAKRRQGMETDPRYADRYHGPDDMARDNDGKLVELEYKGNKTESTVVAKDKNNNRQGSVEKNKRRSEKMTGDKAKKIDQPSNRQGGAYTASEIDLWNDVRDLDGNKRHISVHTNTETGVVRTYERSNKGKIETLLDEFKIEDFDAIKSTLKELLK